MTCRRWTPVMWKRRIPIRLAKSNLSLEEMLKNERDYGVFVEEW
jgi:hypothetical protein